MDAEIVDLNSRRPKPKPAPVAVHAHDAEHYFCMKCDSDIFKLYSGGEVHCVKCGCLMQNLVCGESGK